MNKCVLIAGCGKTALDWGAYLLQSGNEVTWVSRSNVRVESLVKKIKRIQRRAENDKGKIIHIDDLEKGNYFLILEAIEESLNSKKAIWNTVRRYASEKTIMGTNSSSILPGKIGPGIMGCHGFYPMMMTKSAEVISSDIQQSDKRDKLISFLNHAGIYTIIQDSDKKALAVNRLLIPCQEEAFRRLFAGEDSIHVDKMSEEAGFPIGLLSMADSIGLETLHSSVINYKKEFKTINADALIEGTKQLMEAGFLGQKNKKGIAGENNFRFRNNGIPKPEYRSFSDIFNETIAHFLEDSIMNEKDIKQIKESVFMMDK